MMDGTHYSNHRGIAQPETAEEKRRRLHREAAEEVKELAAALKEAKERYIAYDPSNLESQLEELPLGGDEAG